MRSHIDFIQAQWLPWRDASEFGFAGARAKLLSKDVDTNAFSIILGLSQASSQSDAETDYDAEFYVLEGSVTAGGVQYPEHCYGFIPAGMPATITADGDATLLYFRSGSVSLELRTDADKVSARFVPRIDISAGEWDGNFDEFGLGSMKSGARMRVLRKDPFSHETTYVTATIAFRRGRQAERHPITQEFFLLAGELAGELGVMQAGAYCIRPPLAKHGPYGSPTGALIFFRGLGGRQETNWEEADPFTFYPQHKPIVPDELRPFAIPVPRPPRY